MRLSFKTVSCLKDTDDLKSEGDLSLVSCAPAAQHNIFVFNCVRARRKIFIHTHTQSRVGLRVFLYNILKLTTFPS